MYIFFEMWKYLNFVQSFKLLYTITGLPLKIEKKKVNKISKKVGFLVEFYIKK